MCQELETALAVQFPGAVASSLGLDLGLVERPLGSPDLSPS
jgi:hypothetical protein